MSRHYTIPIALLSAFLVIVSGGWRGQASAGTMGEKATEDAPLILWERQLGTVMDDLGYAVATDAQANVFMIGVRNGATFVAKYAANGALLWQKKYSVSPSDNGRGVATDQAGNALVAGFSDAGISLYDAFIVKYSPNGGIRWQRRLATPDRDAALAVATDRGGNVLIAGHTEGSLAGPSQGDYDAFVAKFSPAGQLKWQQQIGTSGFDEARGVTTDGAGNVIVAGLTLGALAAPNDGLENAFVAKYSPGGLLKWKAQFSAPGGAIALGVTTDAAGNVVVAGIPFILKLSPAGALLWQQELLTAGGKIPTSVAADADGNIAVAGYTDNPPNLGLRDGFVAKFSPAGSLTWLTEVGEVGFDEGIGGIATDGVGNMVAAGYTDGSLAAPNKGGWDAFVTKLGADGQ